MVTHSLIKVLPHTTSSKCVTTFPCSLIYQAAMYCNGARKPPGPKVCINSPVNRNWTLAIKSSKRTLIGDRNYILHIPPSLVKISLHTKNKLPRLSGSALFW